MPRRMDAKKRRFIKKLIFWIVGVAAAAIALLYGYLALTA